MDDKKEAYWKLQQKYFSKVMGWMPDHMELYTKWVERIWKHQVVTLCGKGKVVVRECFPEESSKTAGKNERLDIERN